MSSPPSTPRTQLLSCPPPPVQLSPKSPRHLDIPPPFPMRRVESATPQEKGSIRAVVDQWKNGEFDIDQAVEMLLQPSLKRKQFSREVYNRLVEEVRAVPDQKTLIESRKALYAAQIFSKYGDCEDQFNELDKSFNLSEKSFKVKFPEIYR